MRAIVPVNAGISGGFRAPALLLRAVEKTSASSALAGENSDADDKRENPTATLQVEIVYRDDTSRFDPFWDAPRLVPAFVAQLLGQIMPERRDSVMIETAYGRAISPRMALLLDRKS